MSGRSLSRGALQLGVEAHGGIAAANVAVASAYGVWHEATGSALQLLINLCAIVLAGLLTLAVQQTWWWYLARRRRAAG